MGAFSPKFIMCGWAKYFTERRIKTKIHVYYRAYPFSKPDSQIARYFINLAHSIIIKISGMGGRRAGSSVFRAIDFWSAGREFDCSAHYPLIGSVSL